MRRTTSLLALTFLAASALAPAALADNIHFSGVPVCTELPESGQVQCSGALVGLDRGAAPAQVQITVPYHCETTGLHKPPALATGQGEMTAREGEVDVLGFHVMTQPIDCLTSQPPSLGSQVSLRILQGDKLVMERNLPVHITPPPQQ